LSALDDPGDRLVGQPVVAVPARAGRRARTAGRCWSRPERTKPDGLVAGTEPGQANLGNLAVRVALGAALGDNEALAGNDDIAGSAWFIGNGEGRRSGNRPAPTRRSTAGWVISNVDSRGCGQ
jgi:hypothetical protein